MVQSLIAIILTFAFSNETVFVSKAGDQTRVSTTALPSGRIIAVAEDTNCGRPEKHICLYDSGEQLADDSGVSTAFPSISADSSGNLYIVWSDASQIDPISRTRTWDIFLRKKIGSSWLPSERINSKNPSQDQCTTQGDQINPDIYISGTEIHVVWQSIESTGRSFICYVKSPDLGATWLPNKKLFEGYVPAIVAQGNDVFIAFADINGNIKFAKSSDGGQTFTFKNAINVSQRIADLSSPDLAITPSGNIILVWQDKVSKLGGEDIDIFLSVSKNKGETWSTPSQLDLPGDQIQPSVTFLGGTKIFYSQKKSESLGFDIYFVESEGELFISQGENSPTSSASVVSGESSIVVFQLKITASEELSEAEVKTITVKASGTMIDNQHILRISAWHDRDGNGIITQNEDTLLSSSVFSQDNGKSTLTINIPIVSPNPQYIIFAIDLSKPIPRGSDFRIEISPTDVLAVLPGTSKGVKVSGPALQSRTVSVSNNLPVVSLYVNPQNVLENSGVEVVLNAGASYDPDGDPLNFSWTQISGPTINLITSGSTAKFTAPSSVTKNEIIVIEVTVSDNFGGTEKAQGQVYVIDSLNEPPVAIARVKIGSALFDEPIEVSEGDIIILDGSLSYDPNGDSIVYFWTQLSGPKVQISNPSSVTAYFVAPDVVGIQKEEISINLSVRDSKGGASSDQIKIQVRNTKNDPPVAIFTYTPAKGIAPLEVQFDASDSFDPDGSIILYSWRFGDGTEISTTNPKITHTFERPGEYIVELKVTDSANLSSTYSEVVTALSTQPSLYIFPYQVTEDIPFGIPKDFVIIRIGNVSGESILLNSLKIEFSGNLDAQIDFLIDHNSDRVGDVKIFSYTLRTSKDLVIVPLDVIVPGGEGINIILSLTAYPISIPAKYDVSILEIKATSSTLGTQPEMLGEKLPKSFSAFVRRPSLWFRSFVSTITAYSLKAEIPIIAKANGTDFLISSIGIEYDPTIINLAELVEDENGNSKYDTGERIITKFEMGQSFSDISIQIKNGQEKRFLFIAYLSPTTNWKTSPKISKLENKNLSKSEKIALSLILLSLIPVATVLMRKENFVSNTLLLIFFVIFMSASEFSCANKAGKPTTGLPPSQEQSTQAQQQQPQNQTIFKLKSLSASSIPPQEFDLVGLPIEVKIMY